MTSSEAEEKSASEEGYRKEGSQDDYVSVPPWALIAAIAAVLLLAVYGYAEYQEAQATLESRPYNGYLFQETRIGFWEVPLMTNNGETVLEFRTHPEEVEDIPYDDRVNARMRQVQTENGSITITLTDDFTRGGRVGIALYEISKVTNYVFGLNTTGATTAPTNTSYPVVTCEDATRTEAVLRVEKGLTEISYEQGCIVLSAASQDELISAANRLDYGLLGII